MIKNIVYSLILSFLFLTLASAQGLDDSLFMKIKLKFGKQSLELDKQYISKNKDTIKFNTLKFYISNIKIQYSDQTIYSQPNSYHLIDIENYNSMLIPICKNKKEISKVIFSVGVDSTASVSGALSGDLDPSKGMYWAWQSGYINMKIEGNSPSCKTRKNIFQFHIGGYSPPNYALREITLYPKSNTLDIIVNLENLFDSIKLSENNSIMIPGKKAMELADLSTKMFLIE